jgi:hypothetical protein
VAITNRQAVHGSFANTSKDWRVTLNFGFHRRRSVLDVQGGGIHARPTIYTAEHIHERSKMLGYAIDARRQRFPRETPFAYQPHVQSGECYTWDAAAKASIKDYNLLDISI